MSYTLPLFPLSGVVMPGGLMSLRLFERRYLDMISDCFRDNSGFGICLIRQGNEAGVPAEPYPYGTRVSLVDFDQGNDGLLHVVARGDAEFTVLSRSVRDDGLIVADVKDRIIESADVADDVLADLVKKLELILDYLDDERPFVERDLENPDWVCNRLIELLPLPAEARAELIESSDNNERILQLSHMQISVR